MLSRDPCRQRRVKAGREPWFLTVVGASDAAASAASGEHAAERTPKHKARCGRRGVHRILIPSEVAPRSPETIASLGSKHKPSKQVRESSDFSRTANIDTYDREAIAREILDTSAVCGKLGKLSRDFQAVHLTFQSSEFKEIFISSGSEVRTAY